MTIEDIKREESEFPIRLQMAADGIAGRIGDADPEREQLVDEITARLVARLPDADDEDDEEDREAGDEDEDEDDLDQEEIDRRIEEARQEFDQREAERGDTSTALHVRSQPEFQPESDYQRANSEAAAVERGAAFLRARGQV